MKRIMAMVSIATAMILFVGCGDTGNEPLATNVAVNFQVTNQQLRDNVSDGTPKSLTVTQVRLLAKQLKLHINGMPENEEYRLVKLGPVVFRGDAQAPTLAATVQLTSDEYDDFKFEMYRLVSDELIEYSSDTAFADFTTPERYSVVIEGVIDDIHNFKYQTDVVGSVQLPFASAIVVHPHKLAEFLVQFDAATAFMSGNVILDPRVAANKVALDYQIRYAFKALKQ